MRIIDLISCILVHFGDGHFYLLLIQIHSLHPDLQGLDKLTLHIQTYFMAILPALLFDRLLLF